MNKHTIEEGKCPHCGGDDINYESAEFEPGAVYYPSTCRDCGGEWEEWYELKFSGQEVKQKQEQNE